MNTWEEIQQTFLDMEEELTDAKELLQNSLQTIAEMIAKKPYLIFIRHKDEGDHFYCYSIQEKTEEEAKRKVLLAFDCDFTPESLNDWDLWVINPPFLDNPLYVGDVEHFL